MNGLVCRWVGGRVEPNGGDAGHAAPDEIVGLVLELVEPADRHRRIAGHRGFHTEPVPEPAHPDGLDIVDTRHGPDGLFRAVDQGRVDAIQQAPVDAASRARQQQEYCGADQQPDDRIGQRESGPYPITPNTTASEVNPSVLACTPSATSAAERIRRPTRIR